jgi:OmpA-OmpF porin, OOP family
MKSNLSKFAAPIAFAFLAAACATPTPDRITLLPQPDGTSSAIVVRPKAGGELVLSKPYQTASVTSNSSETGVTTATEIEARYKQLADALPVRAQSYLVYFESGSNQLTKESETQLEEILTVVKSLPAVELSVIGHTDTVGTDAVNDDISMKRAELIRQKLVEKGVNTKSVEAVGRGKRAPLIPGDNLNEPRNRRVEIRVK